MKTPILTKGSTVGVVTPSWAGPGSFPEVFDLGLDRLKNIFGIKIKEFSSTRASKDDLYNNPQLRAEDLMLAFEDPEVVMVLASIGGNDSIRILPHIDMSRIIKNQKPFMGFSDSTTLLTYFNQHGLTTFHGPSVMAGFAEPGSLQDEFVKHVSSFLFSDWMTFDYSPYKKWTEDRALWKDPNFFVKEKKYQDNSGWRVLQGSGIVSGKLYGGNIEIFEMLKGTRFMEDLSHLKGKILFLETSEEKPSISYITYALRSMGVRGVFDQISCFLFGRAKDYSDDEKEKIYNAIQKVICIEFKKENLPIIVNMDFGHTQPQWILPIGEKAIIDIDNKSFRVEL